MYSKFILVIVFILTLTTGAAFGVELMPPCPLCDDDAITITDQDLSYYPQKIHILPQLDQIEIPPSDESVGIEIGNPLCAPLTGCDVDYNFIEN